MKTNILVSPRIKLLKNLAMFDAHMSLEVAFLFSLVGTKAAGKRWFLAALHSLMMAEMTLVLVLAATTANIRPCSWRLYF